MWFSILLCAIWCDGPPQWIINFPWIGFMDCAQKRRYEFFSFSQDIWKDHSEFIYSHGVGRCAFFSLGAYPLHHISHKKKIESCNWKPIFLTISNRKIYSFRIAKMCVCVYGSEGLMCLRWVYVTGIINSTVSLYAFIYKRVRVFLEAAQHFPSVYKSHFELWKFRVFVYVRKGLIENCTQCRGPVN